MPLKPRPRDVPKIPGAVRFYRIASYVTGVMLLLLVVEMVLKYTPLQTEMQLGGAGGFFVPVDSITSGFNLSTAILIAHGWLYVVYLFATFRLWSIMRWDLLRFVLIALGGVVPFLSFIVEHRMSRVALAQYDQLVATTAQTEGAPA